MITALIVTAMLASSGISGDFHTAARVAFLALLLANVVHLAPRARDVIALPLFLPWTIFLMIAWISSTHSMSKLYPDAGKYQFAYLGAAAVAYAVAALTNRYTPTLPPLPFLSITGVILSLWALFEMVTGSRGSAIFANPNALAGFLIFVIPVTRALWNDFSWAIPANIIQVLGLLATGSRGGALALAVVVVVCAVWRLRGQHRAKAIFTTAAILAAVFLSRLGEAPERIDHWLNWGQLLSVRPWTGIGYMAGQPLFAHNDYLQFQAELGRLGLGAFLLLLGTAAVVILNRHQQPAEKAILAGIVAVILHAVVDFPFQVPGVMIPFWYAVGTLHYQPKGGIIMD